MIVGILTGRAPTLRRLVRSIIILLPDVVADIGDRVFVMIVKLRTNFSAGDIQVCHNPAGAMMPPPASAKAQAA